MEAPVREGAGGGGKEGVKSLVEGAQGSSERSFGKKLPPHVMVVNLLNTPEAAPSSMRR
jgi:hypothetical protein